MRVAPPSTAVSRAAAIRSKTFRSPVVCLHARALLRYASDHAVPPTDGQHAAKPEEKEDGASDEQGAMSRRLSQMSEESIETGGRSARNAVAEAGFSEELKNRLERKISDAAFRDKYASDIATANMPAGAPKQSRDLAGAKPWTGTETVGDASLRMLNDAHKPLRGPIRTSGIRGPPAKVDTGRPARKAGTGARLANARDKTSVYSYIKESGLSEDEREKLRQEMKQRFAPASRAVPATLQGLASLANERIEDAIARGQFKNLPRGKKIERDYNASSPFIDTTEYFMNKIIQKQEIVPPWIEKQQELVSTAARFRGRLRADWRRHVARVISSRGGTLATQMNLATEYALAEMLANPPRKKTEQMSAIDEDGRVSQITLAGELKAPLAPDAPDAPDAIDDLANAEHEIQIMEQVFNDDGTLRPPEQRVVVHAEEQRPPLSDASESGSTVHQPPRKPAVGPFRDAAWEQTERGYHNAAVENLNSLTRSYNLMAPSLARKPYFYLERELKACFADVAPQVASAIRERALAPKIRGVEVIGHTPGGVLERLGAGNSAAVYDERRPQYGFKEFWKDLFAGSKT